MTSCRVCNSDIQPFMSFGDMPIANGFLMEEDYPEEFFFQMEVAFCKQCCTFQLINQPAPERMFHENYAYFASTSRYMQVHFQAFAEMIVKRILHDRTDPFIVELGSNDGIMLKHYKDAGYRHLGIEPSENVADVARAQGIETLSEFFSFDLAEQLVAQHGQADAVVCANVLCHIPDINSVAAGFATLLKPDGVLTFEDPYLGDVIKKTSYDQIYDEHVFIFSATSVSSIFERHNLELIDVMPQITHGGSMRYMLAPKGSHTVSHSVSKLIETERSQGLHRCETYEQFRRNCEKSRADLVGLLETLRSCGKRIVGYGATSKSTTVLNYCGIGPDHIEFISDTTPIKQGKYTPGVHIPVKSYNEFTANPPDYAVLFAWNHAAEIFEKEQKFLNDGGKWISFVPEVGIIE